MNTQRKKHLQKNTVPILSMVGPTGLWLLLFLAFPMVYVLAISVMTKSYYHGVEWVFSLESYKSLFQSRYLKITWDSLLLALKTSVICLIVAYPFAYILSKMSPALKGFCLLLVMLPFWINGLIRLDGWANIIRDSGIINTFLMHLGVISKPIRMFKTDGAVLFGMVYTFLPFMILPLQTSISKIDSSLIEASRDLGCNRFRTFVRIILPLSAPGIFSGIIQVFIPSLGAFYISDIMGSNHLLLGNLIKNLFISEKNWPAGAALSVILIAFTLAALKLYSKIGNMDDLA